MRCRAAVCALAAPLDFKQVTTEWVARLHTHGGGTPCPWPRPPHPGRLPCGNRRMQRQAGCPVPPHSTCLEYRLYCLTVLGVLLYRPTASHHRVFNHPHRQLPRHHHRHCRRHRTAQVVVRTLGT